MSGHIKFDFVRFRKNQRDKVIYDPDNFSKLKTEALHADDFETLRGIIERLCRLLEQNEKDSAGNDW